LSARVEEQLAVWVEGAALAGVHDAGDLDNVENIAEALKIRKVLITELGVQISWISPVRGSWAPNGDGDGGGIGK